MQALKACITGINYISNYIKNMYFNLYDISQNIIFHDIFLF